MRMYTHIAVLCTLSSESLIMKPSFGGGGTFGGPKPWSPEHFEILTVGGLSWWFYVTMSLILLMLLLLRKAEGIFFLGDFSNSANYLGTSPCNSHVQMLRCDFLLQFICILLFGSSWSGQFDVFDGRKLLKNEGQRRESRQHKGKWPVFFALEDVSDMDRQVTTELI